MCVCVCVYIFSDSIGSACLVYFSDVQLFVKNAHALASALVDTVVS